MTSSSQLLSDLSIEKGLSTDEGAATSSGEGISNCGKKKT
jgi:hypothetical protein